MSLFCSHVYIEDYRQGVNVCHLCGLVSSDLIFGDCQHNNKIDEFDNVERQKAGYIQELNSCVLTYKYNFLKQQYNNNDFSNHVKIYKTVLKIWPKKISRPQLEDMAAAVCYYIYKNDACISIWDIAIYSNTKKEELYKIFCRLCDYTNKHSFNEEQEDNKSFFARDKKRINQLAELFCIKINQYNFSIYKNVSLVANIIYMQYNFTSPLRAITAIALNIYCNDICKPRIKISFKTIMSISGSSKSCLKRLQKIYECNKDLYMKLYMEKQI
jgi:hypothetical protein